MSCPARTGIRVCDQGLLLARGPQKIGSGSSHLASPGVDITAFLAWSGLSFFCWGLSWEEYRAEWVSSDTVFSHAFRYLKRISLPALLGLACRLPAHNLPLPWDCPVRSWASTPVSWCLGLCLASLIPDQSRKAGQTTAGHTRTHTHTQTRSHTPKYKLMRPRPIQYVSEVRHDVLRSSTCECICTYLRISCTLVSKDMEQQMSGWRCVWSCWEIQRRWEKQKHACHVPDILTSLCLV